MTIGKIALLSHILPPAPSGQAVVLQRLLRGFSPERLCLISSSAKDGCACDPEFQRISCFRIHSSIRLPAPTDSYLFAPSVFFNVAVGIAVRARRMERIVRQQDCRLIVACSGDICDLPAAALVARRLKIPLVAYMFDDYQWQWTGVHRVLSKRLEPLVLKQASGIIVPNELLADAYRGRCDKPVSIIRNPTYLPDLQSRGSGSRRLENRYFNIVYTGSIYRAHFDAFTNLVMALNFLGDDVRLHLFTSQDKDSLKKRGIDGEKVQYHKHLSASEVAFIQGQADLLFLPLAFNSPIKEVIKTSAPGKMSEYLATGRPVLAHAPAGSFVNWYLKKHDCGIVVDQENPRMLAQKIQEVMSSPEFGQRLGVNARACAERDFTVMRAQGDFVRFVDEILSKAQGS